MALIEAVRIPTPAAGYGVGNKIRIGNQGHEA